MTETSKDKEVEKLNPQSKSIKSRDLTPEIAKLAKKKVVSLVPATAIIVGLTLLLLAFFYMYFFKHIPGSDLSDINKAILKPEITKKEFSFKKVKSEEISQPLGKIIEKPIVKSSSELLPVKPAFRKYISIPVKSDLVTATVDSSKDNKTVSQEPSEAAVIAERITIDPNFLIPEGTYIPCSLMTKFTSDVTGRITCTIAEDVHSANGLVKLIDKGTKAIGVYQGGNLKHGVGRMFVIWTKLITPDFKSIKLVDSQVVGQLGEAGIDGWIDSHFFQRFGGAILLSTVKDIVKMTQQKGQKGENGTSVNINTMDNTKDSFVSIVEKMLENSINIPPTMYKNQGDIIGILVGRDIDFSKVYRLKINK